jgi:hypothetical protein
MGERKRKKEKDSGKEMHLSSKGHTAPRECALYRESSTIVQDSRILGFKRVDMNPAQICPCDVAFLLGEPN